MWPNLVSFRIFLEGVFEWRDVSASNWRSVVALSSVKIAKKSNQVIEVASPRIEPVTNPSKNSHRCEPHDLPEKQFCFLLFQIQILRNPALFTGPPVVELQLVRSN